MLKNKTIIAILYCSTNLLFSATTQQAFDYFYPSPIANCQPSLYPYFQEFASSVDSSFNPPLIYYAPTFVCYDPIILSVMYYIQQNDIANLISILQNSSFLTKEKIITAYQAVEQNENSLNKQGPVTMPVKSCLNSWIYAGQPSQANSYILYPILILGQGNVAMQILLENGADPNFLGYSPIAISGNGVNPSFPNYAQMALMVDQAQGKNPIRNNSALLYAIQQNNLDTANILLSYGADPNISNGGSQKTSANAPDISTPYLYAQSQSNSSSQMLTLLQKFGGGKQFSATATNALQAAVKNANIDGIQSAFQQNADINASINFDHEEMSILQYIVLQPESYPKYDILNTLFNLSGLAINFKSSTSGTTPLMAAVCIEDTGKLATCSNCTGMTEVDAIIKLLVQNGADPFLTNSNGVSPYQVISSKLNNILSSNPEYNFLTQKLILLINNMNYTLLTIGYYLYNLSLVSLAEKLNTNLTITQSRNVSTVANTAQYKNLITSDKPTLENIITIIKSFPTSGQWSLMSTEVNILKTIILNYLKLGGSLGAQYNGDTILSAAQSTHNNHLIGWIKSNFGNILTFIDAVNAQNITQVSSSLNRGVAVDTLINANGDSALIYACSKGNIDLVNLLLKYKANINFQNSLGQAPILIAAKYAPSSAEPGIFNLATYVPSSDTTSNSYYQIINLLISQGANINLRDNYENNAFDVAMNSTITGDIGNFNAAIAQLLSNAGADY